MSFIAEWKRNKKWKLIVIGLVIVPTQTLNTKRGEIKRNFGMLCRATQIWITHWLLTLTMMCNKHIIGNLLFFPWRAAYQSISIYIAPFHNTYRLSYLFSPVKFAFLLNGYVLLWKSKNSQIEWHPNGIQMSVFYMEEGRTSKLKNWASNATERNTKVEYHF